MWSTFTAEQTETTDLLKCLMDSVELNGISGKWTLGLNFTLLVSKN